MATNCLDNNLHNNSGTSQAQRALEALSAGYAKVDERSTADLILFAKKYGVYLNYYDANNAYAGDWSAFMSKNISSIIAALQDWRAKDYIGYINNLYDNIKSAATNVVAQENFKYIFDFIFSLSKNLNDTLWQLPADSDYAKYLNVAIASKLALPVKQLNDYYLLFLQTGNALNSLIPPPASIDSFAPFDSILFTPLDAANFQSTFAFINNIPWILPANVIPPPANMLTGDSINDIITNNFFTGAVTSFLNGIISIVNQTATYLDKTLSNYPTHAPHYALYLAFLRLFKFAQDHLNNFTERHLEFYYKKVLQLKNNLGLPDTAHLVFTLQKSIDQHLLSKDTQFKAGKDANGNDLFYSLTDDIVINQASVQVLKSLYIVKNYINENNVVIPQQLFASTIANSADGQGAKLTSIDQSWYPFGDLGNTDFVTKSTANIGFAIASNILFLNEGTRTITITFSCDPSVAVPAYWESTNIFSAKFTGDKKWFDASGYSPNVGNTDPNNNVEVKTDSTGNQLTVTITLNGNAPPIVPYSQKIHGGNFIQSLPMVRITLADYTYYYPIKLLRITSIDINVNVDVVKNLSLQNDDGKIDGSKPFKPFGEFPESGASFIIGSKEIFQKKLTSLSVNFTRPPVLGLVIHPIFIEEMSIHEIGETHKFLDFYVLEKGNWLPCGSVQFSGGNSLPLHINKFNIPFSLATFDFSSNTIYNLSAVDGFIKIQLIDSEYNLSTYLDRVQTSLTTTSVDISGVGTADQTYTIKNPPKPQLPSSPVVPIAYISYTATTSIDLTNNGNFSSRTNFFYHIEPFGFREMHPFLLTPPPKNEISIVDYTLHVLPVFNLQNDSYDDHTDKGTTSALDNEGELWIGLSNTKPGETQSILFQVSEGSSNPLKDVAKIKWFYMSANNWIALKHVNINDQTHNLSQSGLVIFNLPGDETTNNTRADNNLLWIKAVVQNNTDAVCKLITVQANAAKAQFVTDFADKIYFTNNIAAGTISKPAVADAALKQTSQPYPSFGGRPIESGQQFNQRVSERLRHKHRAVTAWDYERLVLQNFPQIHKVKCLNHTNLKKSAQDYSYSELKPGDVMIVTVPDLSLVTGANPLLPFTNVGLLDDIQKYLKQFCSPFVHVHACNPQFEAVQFTFNVYFINGNANSSYYTQQLNTDIQKFLMPWAFGSSASDIEFGGKIEKSVVLNFAQSRPYVDFVTCFTMTQFTYKEDGTYNDKKTNLEEAIALTARSILVPYSQNIITPTAKCTSNA